MSNNVVFVVRKKGVQLGVFKNRLDAQKFAALNKTNDVQCLNNTKLARLAK